MEVLVAVVVLSVGLLGVAGLQTTGINANNGAFYKTQATVLAADMADRIRANPLGQNSYTPNAAAFDTSTSAIPGDPGCLATGCNPAEMAQYDLYQWNQYLVGDAQSGALAMLPEGRGIISRGPDNEFRVTVLWRQRYFNDTGVATAPCINGQENDVACVEMRFQ